MIIVTDSDGFPPHDGISVSIGGQHGVHNLAHRMDGDRKTQNRLDNFGSGLQRGPIQTPSCTHLPQRVSRRPPSMKNLCQAPNHNSDPHRHVGGPPPFGKGFGHRSVHRWRSRGMREGGGAGWATARRRAPTARARRPPRATRLRLAGRGPPAHGRAWAVCPPPPPLTPRARTPPLPPPIPTPRRVLLGRVGAARVAAGGGTRIGRRAPHRIGVGRAPQLPRAVSGQDAPGHRRRRPCPRLPSLASSPLSLRSRSPPSDTAPLPPSRVWGPAPATPGGHQ